MYPELLTRHAGALKDAWDKEAACIISDMSALGHASAEATQLVANFLSAPGKLIRPSLFLAGYEAYKDRVPSPTVIRLAISLELLHLYLLVHDDIIDASNMRRGVPALHKQLETQHETLHLRGDSTLFGEGMALLLGDLLCTQAESIWTEAIGAGTASSTARALFDTLKREVCWGQYQDIMLAASSMSPTETEIIAMMVEKSGKYSIERPLELGALVAGATREQLRWMEEFGTHLGVVFQTVDDILGTFGDPVVTGKSVDSDLLERKCTLLVYFLLQNALPDDKVRIEEFFGYTPAVSSGNLSPSDVRSFMEKYKVVARTREVVQSHYDKSVQALAASNLAPAALAELKSFAEFLMQRNK